jgi:hypothetical protein
LKRGWRIQTERVIGAALELRQKRRSNSEKRKKKREEAERPFFNQ